MIVASDQVSCADGYRGTPWILVALGSLVQQLALLVANNKLQQHASKKDFRISDELLVVERH